MYVDGVDQVPIQGNSLVYTFDDANAPETHTTQYFEIFANRGIYKDGWFARVIHKEPWAAKPIRSLQEDIWELYDTNADFSLSTDIAAQNPDKLEELKALFMQVASENHALPLDDRGLERLNPAIAGRPDLMGDRTSLTLAHGMKDLSENAFINIKNKSKSIVAEVDVPQGGATASLSRKVADLGAGVSTWMKANLPTPTIIWVRSEPRSQRTKRYLKIDPRSGWILPTMAMVSVKAVWRRCF